MPVGSAQRAAFDDMISAAVRTGTDGVLLKSCLNSYYFYVCIYTLSEYCIIEVGRDSRDY